MDVVYVFTNVCMPSLVKIGYTNDLDERLRNLYKTGVPERFECFFACTTIKDAKTVEKDIHDAFKEQRINPNREFFEIDPNRVVSALRPAMSEEVTPKKGIILEDGEDEKEAFRASDKLRERRSKFNFQMVGIEKGAKLYFARDENIMAEVTDNNKIKYEGQIFSLSSLAQKLLNSGNVQGPLYWVYQGETLLERRKRMEEDE